MTQILLADHHPQAMWALKIALQEQIGVEVIGEAADADGLVALALKKHPDLVLLDKELPGKSTEEIITALHQLLPIIPVVIVMSSDPALSRAALKAGADAFVSKGEEPEWLLQSLQKYIKANPKKEETKETNPGN